MGGSNIEIIAVINGLAVSRSSSVSTCTGTDIWIGISSQFVSLAAGCIFRLIVEKIKEKKPTTFQHIAANALKLWIVSAPIEQLLETDLHDLQPAHAPLLPVKRLGNLYLDAPPEEHLHIIVQPPPGIAGVSSKLFVLYDISYFLQLLPIRNPFLS